MWNGVTWSPDEDGVLSPYFEVRGIRKKASWAPQEGSQLAFLSCPCDEVLYHGPRGGGKTDCLIADFCQGVGVGYGSHWVGILFRRTFPELEDVIAKSKEIIPKIWPAAKYNEGNHTWSWPTGERLKLRHFAREDDYWKYHGHQYPWIGWEELTTWSSPVGYLRMFTTNRCKLPSVPLRIRATTNPYGPGHNWVKHRFQLSGVATKTRGRVVREINESKKALMTRTTVYGHLAENRVLLHAQPDYLSRVLMGANNEAERRAWELGDWDIVAGGMFDDIWFKAQPFVKVPAFKVPDSWRIDRSFDWGESRPFSVGWWAESDGTDVVIGGKLRSTVRGDLFRINEWYGWTGKPNEGSRLLAREIARGIVEREIALGISGRVRPGPADSSIFDDNNGNNIARDMEQPVRIGERVYSGVRWTKADKSPGSRAQGWQQIRAYLDGAINKGVPREKPGLFVVESRCPNWLRTVPVLPRDNKKLDDVDTEAEDHAGDETRYRVRAERRVARSGRTRGHS